MIDRWDDKIVQLFRDFSDKEFQKETWLGLSDQIASPAEMCNWIEDLDLEGWVGSKSFQQHQYLKHSLENFIILTNSMPDHSDPLEAFASPDWSKIRLMSEGILKMLEDYLSERS